MTEHFWVRGRKFVPEGSLPPGDFRFIEHDDLAKDEKGQRIRAPEVFPLYWVQYADLTSAWQWFWFRVGLVHPYTNYQHWDETRLRGTEQEQLRREWRSLTHGAKAFTNNTGTDLYRDYISGENLREALPKQGAITCCGNIVKVVGPSTSKGTPIETLNGSLPPPPIEKVNRLTTPWLVFCAVNIPGVKVDNVERPIIINGRVRADPFPNLEPKDTCVPLRSNGNKVERIYTTPDGIHIAVNYIRSSRLRAVSGRVVPRPYVP